MATICYSLQWTLYTKYSRKYDWLRIAQIRNISMIFTGLPLLFFSTSLSRTSISPYIPLILLSWMVWAIHVFVSYKSYTYVPAWISQVIKKSVKSITALIISLFILHEVFTVSQWRWLALISLGAIRLGSHKIDIRHLDLQNIRFGIFLVVLAWILSAITRYIFSLYNSAFDPYLATYAAGLHILRYQRRRRPRHSPPLPPLIVHPLR